jgi:hypothetical protein
MEHKETYENVHEKEDLSRIDEVESHYEEEKRTFVTSNQTYSQVKASFEMGRTMYRSMTQKER